MNHNTTQRQGALSRAARSLREYLADLLTAARFGVGMWRDRHSLRDGALDLTDTRPRR